MGGAAICDADGATLEEVEFGSVLHPATRARVNAISHQCFIMPPAPPLYPARMEFSKGDSLQ